MMKVYILADLEGISGVNEYDDWLPNNVGHQMIRTRMIDLMVGEVNAAVEGALAAGATTVVVRDAHSWSNNLPREKLHKKALLSQGQLIEHPLPHLEADFAALVMVGYHAKAGNVRGSLSHTYSRRIRSVHVNGVEIGEIGLNAAIAGELGVPVCFVSGDSEAVQEAHLHLENIVSAETKISHSIRCTLSRAPTLVQAEITAGVKRGLEQITLLKPFVFAAPVELQVRYHAWYVNLARYLLRRQWHWGRVIALDAVVYRGDNLTQLWQHFISGS